MLKSQLAMALLASIFSAGSLQAQENSQPLPRNPNEVLRKGDLMFTRLNVDLSGKEREKAFETTSFDIIGSRTVHDQCRFAIINSDKVRSSEDGQALPPQRLDSVTINTEIPDFILVGFLEDLRPAAEKIFASVVDVDDLEGPVFKREDLRERLRMAMTEKPFNSLPQLAVADMEQAFVAHIWGYWGEVSKLKKKIKNMDEIKVVMADQRAQWLTKLGENVRGNLQEQLRIAQKEKRELKSDRLTRTYVTMNFNWKEGKGAAASQLQCTFEGEKKTISLDRLNAVINPNFELVPRKRQAMEAQFDALEQAKEDDKRRIAVDGQSINSN